MHHIISSQKTTIILLGIIGLIGLNITELKPNSTPPPTEILQKKKDRKQFKKDRLAWMEQMHRAAPGVDYKQMNQQTRSQNQSFWTSQRQTQLETTSSRHIPGAWFERGSNNLAGRIRTAIFDFNTNEIYCASSGGNIWRGNIDGTDWISLNDYFQITGIHFLHRLDLENSTRMLMVNGKNCYFTDDDGFTIESATGLSSVQNWGSIKRCVITGNDIYLAVLEWDYVAWTYLQAIYHSDDFGESFSKITELTSADGFVVGSSNFDIWAHHDGPIFVLNDGSCYQLNNSNLMLVGTISTGSSGANILVGGKDGDTIYLHARIGSILYSSFNNGLSWENQGEFPTGTFTINSLESHPTDPQKLAIGNVDGYYTTNGGSNWNLINNWWEYYSAPETKLHADLPEFNYVMNPNNGDEFQFISTDGGLYISYDEFSTVENLSMEGLGVSQYYSTYTARTSPHHAFAGSQDQGFQRHLATEEEIEGILDFEQTISGDYGHIVSSDGGQSLWTDYPGFIMHYPNIANSTSYFTWDFQGSGYLWLPPIMSDPYQNNIAYIGGGGIDDQNHMVKVTLFNNNLTAEDMVPTFSDKISAMAWSPVTNHHWFVATSDGNFYYSQNMGQSFTQTTSFAGPESHYFYGSTILPSPINDDRVYFGGSGYSNPAVYMSDDGGESFSSLSEGLPNTLVYELACLPDESMIFAATAVGPYVYKMSDGTWENMSEGEAPDQTYWTVDYVPEINTVRFGTYGRGIWDYTFDYNPVVYLGDIDQNGHVNIQDIITMVGIIMNQETISDYQMHVGDLDKTGSIDINDLLLLVDLIR